VIIAQHIHDGHGWQGYNKQIGALFFNGADQQSAIGAAHDSQLGRRGVFLLD
jgi:hypothetical protein